MQKCVAEAVTIAANIILVKMALNDEENLSEIKREIIKTMQWEGEPVPQDPLSDTNLSNKTQ